MAFRPHWPPTKLGSPPCPSGEAERDRHFSKVLPALEGACPVPPSFKWQQVAEQEKAGTWATAPDWMRDKANERTAPKAGKAP